MLYSFINAICLHFLSASFFFKILTCIYTDLYIKPQALFTLHSNTNFHFLTEKFPTMFLNFEKILNSFKEKGQFYFFFGILKNVRHVKKF